MKLFHIILGLLTVAAMVAPADAQGFRTRGTRHGAVAGAIIGGIIGNQNNETAAGIVVGGLVGGVAGRFIGTQQDRRYYGNGYGQTYYQQPVYQQPAYYPVQQQYVPRVQYYQQPVYSPRSYGYGYGSSCGRGW